MRKVSVMTALLLGCSALAAPAQDSANPVVSVTGGQIQGQMMPAPGGAVFKGIPYAAPPVGELRWRETMPVKPWTGVKQTVEFGPGCVAERARDKASEDCLYLNVWVPQWPVAKGQKLAVMFWIPGGELYGNSGALKAGSESLARHGVILVSATYRSQLMGIPGHPELTAESPHHASGNYMFYDEVAALKWVHNNIAGFGGDPSNVTLMGQSGGAHFISMFLTSPLAKGLVNRAIVESGAVGDALRPYLTLAELEQIGLAMAKSLNAPSTGALAYLRSLPQAQITAAMGDVRKRLAAENFAAYDEGVDGYTITQSPPDMYRAGKQLAVPLLVGNTARDTEALNLAAPGATINPADGRPVNKTPNTREEEAAWVKGVLEVFYEKYPDLLDKAMKAYGLNGEVKTDLHYAPYGTLPQQVGSDLNHRCGTRIMAMWHTRVAPTWEWEFSRSVRRPALHGSELTYVFGTLSPEQLADPNAVKVRDQMQTYWTNFAKTGNPNGPGLPPWPQFNAAHPQSMEFVDDGATVRTENRAEICAPYIEKLTREPHPMSGGAGQRIRPGNIGAAGD